jgi:hypothetical protein
MTGASRRSNQKSLTMKIMTIKYEDLSGSYYPNCNEKNSNTLSLKERSRFFTTSIGCTLLRFPNPVFWMIYKKNNKQKKQR